MSDAGAARLRDGDAVLLLDDRGRAYLRRLRAGMQIAVRRKFGLRRVPAFWLIPLRELLSFTVWCASHLGQSVL